MARMNWDHVRGENALARTWDYSARLDDEDNRLHGLSDGAKGAIGVTRPARRRSKAKRVAGETPILPRALQPKPVTRADRQHRDAEAEGISVQKLRERRRQVAIEGAALAAEARRRGFTTKQLRRMIERGEAGRPALPQMPGGRTVVSSTGRTRRAERQSGGPAR